MYGSSSPASTKDLNLPFPPPAVPPFGGHRKEGTDLHGRHQQLPSPPPPQQQHMSSGLLRYRSAPSSLLGEVCDDFLPVRPSSPETDNILARFLTPDLRDEIRDKPAAGVGQRSSSQFSPAPPPPSSAPMEHGAVAAEVSGQQNGGFSSASAQLLYQQQQQQQMANQSAVESAYRVVSSTAMDAEQMKNAAGSGGSCSNLVRHSSSPAGLFAHLNVENGYAMMRGMGGFREGNGSMGDGASRLKGQISFSSRQNSATGLMSQISEVGSEGMGVSSPEDGSFGAGNGGGRCFIPGYPITSWDDTRLLPGNFSGIKRGREAEEKIIAGLNPSDPQNGEVRSHVSGLTHQFSLPKTSSEMAAIEKFLQFQDAVPCKIRAKRGCATHPRSIAERVRRTRISERMRKLQELVPNMDKQTNTADMLDLAVDYIKDLQKQVKTLSESRAGCTCPASKEKPCSNQAS